MTASRISEYHASLAAKSEDLNFGTAVSRSKYSALIKNLLFKWPIESENEQIASIMFALAKSCTQAKSFDAARKELGLDDLNYLKQ